MTGTPAVSRTVVCNGTISSNLNAFILTNKCLNYFQQFSIHPLDNNFKYFTHWVIFQTTFFIIFTTILLNIIFGIIVDTFSELRDLRVSNVRYKIVSFG